MSVRLDHGDVDLTEMHEINVTPFIDVILVLLIIFMIAAPLATVDVSVDLPASTAQPQQRPDKPLFVTLKADLSLAIGDETVAAGRPRSGTRSGDGRRQGAAYLSAGGQDGRLWRSDAGDECSARRRLSESGVGRVGIGRTTLTFGALTDRDERRSEFFRWTLCATVVLAAHGLAIVLLHPKSGRHRRGCGSADRI